MDTEKRLDETTAGGAYLVNGKWVDAFGQRIADPNGNAPAKADAKKGKKKAAPATEADETPEPETETNA